MIVAMKARPMHSPITAFINYNACGETYLRSLEYFRNYKSPLYVRCTHVLLCVGNIVRVSSLNNATCSVENDPTDCATQYIDNDSELEVEPSWLGKLSFTF